MGGTRSGEEPQRRGERGEESWDVPNERLSDMTLVEVAREFGVRSWGAAGRACHGIQLKREADRRFRRRLENPEDVVRQQ